MNFEMNLIFCFSASLMRQTCPQPPDKEPNVTWLQNCQIAQPAETISMPTNKLISMPSGWCCGRLQGDAFLMVQFVDEAINLDGCTFEPVVCGHCLKNYIFNSLVRLMQGHFVREVLFFLLLWRFKQRKNWVRCLPVDFHIYNFTCLNLHI